MRLTVILIVLFSAFTAKSSDLIFAVDQHSTINLEEGYNEYSIGFYSPLEKEVTYKWELLNNTLLDEWDYSLCDYGNCYFSIPDSGTMISISQTQAKNQKNAYFKLSISGAGVSGTGELKIYVYDGDDKDYGDTLSFTVINSVTASAQDHNLEISSLYPNPANSSISITAKAGDQIHFMNSLGVEVESIELINGTATINVIDWDRGVYYYYIENREGRRSKAAPLVIQ